MRFFEKSGNRFFDAFFAHAFLFTIALNLLFFGAIIILGVVNGKGMNHVSGVWMAIATDLRDGVFYRPLFDDSMGYGGTRFFPLFFSLVALAASALGSVIVAGHTIAISSGLLLLVSCYLFMRRFDVTPVISLALCVLLLAPFSIQHGFQSVRGDLLPLALNVLGLAVYLGKSVGKKSLLFTVVMFVLAFSAKVTAIHGVASLCIWLMLDGERREARKLLLYTLVGYATVLGLMHVASSGRVFEIFEACASGGATFITLLRAPIRFSTMSSSDLPCVLLLFWAVSLLCYRIRDIGMSFPTVFFGLRNRFSVIGLGTRFLRRTPIGQVQILPAG